MKKRISIVYFDNGDFAKRAERELVYRTLINEFIDEGKTVFSMSEDMVVFTDNSVITMYKLGFFTKMMRSTHVYIDKSLLHLSDCDSLLSEVVEPMLFKVEDGNRYNLDGDRLTIYEVVNGKLETKKYR